MRRLNSLTLVLIYLIVIIGVGLLVPVEADWSPKYGSEHKQPLGTYILFQQLSDVFPDVTIRRSIVPAFNYLRDEGIGTNYLFINDVFEPDQLDVDKLLEFVADGGQAMISAEQFSGYLLDTLQVEVEMQWHILMPFFEDTLMVPLQLTQGNVRHYTTELNSLLQGSAFNMEALSDSIDYEVLGHRMDEPNFLRFKIGLGVLYLHLCPAVFSNYAMLHCQSSSYASAVLSYLPPTDLVFDDYYKSGKSRPKGSLSILFSQPAMRWAWNLALFSVLLFMIFGARRKTRVIPVLHPFENDSLKFIETVGAMHLQQQDHQVIADKRLQLLMRYVNGRFHLRRMDWENQNAELFAERTGTSTTKWETLFKQIDEQLVTKVDGVESLKSFSNTIDQIYIELKK